MDQLDLPAGTAPGSGRPQPSASRASRLAIARRAWGSAVAGAVALYLIIRMAWQSGGYFADSHLTAGAVALGTLAVLLVLHPPHYRLSTPALVGLAALAGLAAWTGISAYWSPSPDGAIAAMQLDLCYLGLFGLGLLAAGSGRFARALLLAGLGVIVVIVGAGLLSRLYPDVVNPGPDVGGLAAGRLQYPLEYWNAFGALAAVGAALALGLAADARGRIEARALFAAVAVAMFVSMYLSLSRGAWLALLGGLIVLIAMSPHRGSLILSALLIGGACAVALLRLRTYPELTNAPPANAAPMSAGHAYGPQLLVLLVGVAAGQGIMAAGRRSAALMRALRRAARPVGLTLAGAVVLLFVIAYGLRAGTVEGWTEARLNSASRYITKQWNEFLTPATFTATGTARLGTAKGTRSDLYRLAFDGFEGNPLRGDGGGSFPIRFFRYRKVDESVRNAHSLELETLGELGLVGGLLLIALLGSGVAAAVQSRRRPSALNRSQAVAVAAALTVWVVHSFVDWDWQVPALTGVVLILAASLYPYGRERSLRRRAQAPI